MTDEQIINAISEGGAAKEKAAGYLIQTHIGFVRKIQANHKITDEEAKDAFTDAVIGLLQSIDSQRFRGDSKISTYLYKIFYFKCLDLLRKKSTNKVDYLENLPDARDAAADTFKDLLLGDQVKRLHIHLDTIGEPCKSILLDWGFWGYKMPEIAERNGLEDAGKAKKKKYRCLQKLLTLINIE